MSQTALLQKKFKIIIERDEDGYFVASVPALPGCYTQGKTFKELMDNVKDAIKLCLDVAKTDPQYRKQIQAFGYEPTMVGVELVTL